MTEEHHVTSAIAKIVSKKRSDNEIYNSNHMLGATFNEIQKTIEKTAGIPVPPIPLEHLLMSMIRIGKIISINHVFVTPEILRYDNDRMTRR